MEKNLQRHFLNQSVVKPKPIVTCLHAFSRAWVRLHVFTLSSASVVIGQSDWFCFYDTQLKTALFVFDTSDIECHSSLCGPLVSTNRTHEHAIITNNHILDMQSSFDD